MIVTESKIAATHRLQKGGRWEEASEYRGEQRQKFCSEGFTRKESNDKAWEAMILAYPPPPNEDTAAYFDKESERPWFYLDHKSASFFSVYCKIRAELYRLCPVEIKQADKPTTERRLEPQTRRVKKLSRIVFAVLFGTCGFSHSSISALDLARIIHESGCGAEGGTEDSSARRVSWSSESCVITSTLKRER